MLTTPKAFTSRTLGMSIGAKVVFGCHVSFGLNSSLWFVFPVSLTRKRAAVLLCLILIELWKVRLGEDAETSTRGRVRSPN